jgi:hypothetical protein
MNRASITSPPAPGPIIGYPISPTVSRPRKHRRPLKKGEFPGVKVRMLGFMREELRAAAHCIGIDSYHFAVDALFRAIMEVERELGIPVSEMVALSRADRARLGARYRMIVPFASRAPADFPEAN